MKVFIFKVKTNTGEKVVALSAETLGKAEEKIKKRFSNSRVISWTVVTGREDLFVIDENH